MKQEKLSHTGSAAIENPLNNRQMRLKIARNSVFDCHLSPVRQQMTIKNIVSNNFLSMFVDSINVVDCPPTGCVSPYLMSTTKAVVTWIAY